MYIQRFKSGRISHYLRPAKIITGKYAIQTANLHPQNFVINMNYPLFNSAEEAEKFLQSNFEKEA